jgi:DNA-binding response OmpR family regulator
VATEHLPESAEVHRLGSRAASDTKETHAMADGDKRLILVVEDDSELRDEILRPGLHRAGFDTVGAGSAFEAYRSLLARDYSMFILDIGLPDEDGLTLARNLRASTNAGIIMLTGRRPSNADRVRGLDDGADAYITKPVDLEVLAATVRSVLRRIEGKQDAHGSVPSPATGWHPDMGGWNLVAPNGRSVRLSQPERILVELLFATPNEAVARSTIIARLTLDARNFDPHRLEMLVYRLRRKALAETDEALPVDAVRGIGYVFVAR